ncbi:CRM-domain containing factor CFM3, chloroplastic/mitochondrial [Mercurialis annua]|uniref:CRM-domain containing factor CFM3, chloroplastic/mitochondrial n=1 Tax=Mercurialis annua TaxID=3986 RepID=UPI00215DD7E3|nr:CRM-domain containing factor CFM3, chloroplastic/mitochondrial [Mercurialis annua]
MAITSTTAKLTELPLRNSLPLFSSKTPKPSFQSLNKFFCSSSQLRTNQNPKSNNPTSPWLSKWTPDSPTKNPPKPAQSNAPPDKKIQSFTKGQNAIERIVLRLRNLGLGSDDEDGLEPEKESELEGGGELVAVTGEERLADLLKREWVRPDTIFINGGEEEEESSELALPWARKVNDVEEVVDRENVRRRVVKAPSLAELTIEDEELRRLRRNGMHLRERVSVAKAGLTNEIVGKIHEKWRKNELVRLKFHEILAHDMKTAHEITERRTGGLVIWKAGSVMVVYRGSNYEGPQSKSQPVDQEVDTPFVPDVSSAGSEKMSSDDDAPSTTERNVSLMRRIDRNADMTEEEVEFNKLLDGLGPRFEEWWGTGILPVDADLLPPKIPGYKTPFRLLPTGMRSSLTNAEMTNLRKLAKKLPCHFSLGRNRNHQGLASAILKLWEKSLVAKIAVKRGIQNTNNKLMADELKMLTGGVVLLRNKYYIVIYRGKDFLPTSVAAVLAERQELTKQIQDVEEKVRIRGVETVSSGEEEGKPLAGTLAEFYQAQARWGKDVSAEEREKMIEDDSRAKRARMVKKIEHKLAVAQAKKLKAERLLAKIEVSMIPSGPDYDQETVTDEEKAMFRRVGLRMKAYLPLGIRGVFDGVIENMHLHWKHRELVKLISKQKTLAFVEDTARLLEFESGGILVAIERVPKGFAIIYYRGKNYQRPINLRPKNLLTKAKALKRSVAMQRHEALSQHISELEGTIEQMKAELGFSPEDDESNRTSDEHGQSNDVSEFIQSQNGGSFSMNLESEDESDEEEEDDDVDDDDDDEDDDDDDDHYDHKNEIDNEVDWEANEDFESSDLQNETSANKYG